MLGLSELVGPTRRKPCKATGKQAITNASIASPWVGLARGSKHLFGITTSRTGFPSFAEVVALQGLEEITAAAAA